jgi:hypothetical protein
MSYIESIIMNPIIDEFEDKRWYNNNGELHRLEGPAIEYKSGTKYWFNNGELHRLEGPAVEFAAGTKFWYINGKQIYCNNNTEFLRIVKMKELL